MTDQRHAPADLMQGYEPGIYVVGSYCVGGPYPDHAQARAEVHRRDRDGIVRGGCAGSHAAVDWDGQAIVSPRKS